MKTVIAIKCEKNNLCLVVSLFLKICLTEESSQIPLWPTQWDLKKVHVDLETFQLLRWEYRTAVILKTTNKNWT